MDFDARQLDRYFVQMAQKNPVLLSEQFALLPEKIVRRVKKDWASNWRTRKHGVDKGRLRSSVVGEGIRPQGGDWVAGVTARTEYARVHEFGFDGDVNVRSHTRRTKRATDAVIGERTKTQIFLTGKSKSGFAFVNAFTREMHVTEKRYLRNPLPAAVKLWLKGYASAWKAMMRNA